MKVLDLFAGLRGWSRPWEERGHEVFSIDLDERFEVSLHADVREVGLEDLPWRPDVILASPPCEGFTVLQIGRNWTHDHRPKTAKARLAVELVRATLRIIEECEPAFWVIENPRAKLRKLPELAGFERRTVTYCQFGERRMKPTDLWGGFPPSLALPPPCKNGAPCHVRAPRGSRTGTQGMDPALSAKIPERLALAVCLAAERDLPGGTQAVGQLALAVARHLDSEGEVDRS